MATLTAAQTQGFSAAQLTEIAKMPESALDKDEAFAGTAAAYKTAILAKWKGKSAEALHAKVCDGGKVHSGGNPPVIVWSTESDITAAQKASIQDMGAAGVKYEKAFEDVMGGKKSVEQRLAALEKA